MLVGSGVKDNIGAMRDDNLLHPRLVSDVSQERFKRWTRLGTSKFLLDEKQSVFTPLDQQQLFRTKTQNLSTNFRAD